MLPFGTTCTLGAIFLVSLGIGALAHGTQPAPQDDPSRPEYFTAHVKPVFDSNCARCHEGLNHRGAFNMNTRSAMIRGGKDGTALIPGDPDHSLLVRLIRHQGPPDDPMPMPPKQPKLSDSDIAAVAAWVRAGAPVPPDAQ